MSWLRFVGGLFKVGLELESGEWADSRSGFGRVCVFFCGEVVLGWVGL